MAVEVLLAGVAAAAAQQAQGSNGEGQQAAHEHGSTASTLWNIPHGRQRGLPNAHG